MTGGFGAILGAQPMAKQLEFEKYGRKCQNAHKETSTESSSSFSDPDGAKDVVRICTFDYVITNIRHN